MLRSVFVLLGKRSRWSSKLLKKEVATAYIDITKKTFQPPQVLQAHFYSTRTETKHATSTVNQWRPKLIIFDKNGTLMSFHSIFTSSWITTFAHMLKEETGHEVTEELYDLLNICRFTNKARTGLLGHGSASQIKTEVSKLLIQNGCNSSIAESATETCWRNCDVEPGAVEQLSNLKQLFNKIREQGIKIAICTSDTRAATEKTLEILKLTHLVDNIRCADDQGTLPKPDPSSISKICEEVGVSVRDAVMIGDTEADVAMGYDAGAGLTVGVLSGIGTRLDLAQYADYVVEDVQQFVNKILPDEVHVPIVRRLRAAFNNKKSSVNLVIFDKDGTLICFHSMWTPWAKDLVKRLEDETGLKLYDSVMTELGFCHDRQKWKPGLLAQGTQAQNKQKVKAILEENGMDRSEASNIVEKSWKTGNHDPSSKDVRILDNPTTIFQILHDNGIKVAICTADSREGTMQFVQAIGAEDYIDLIVCGDDPQTEPKPSPQNATEICRTLGVDPSRAVIVGDTIADMGMGKSAKLGATVAVLSGVGDVKDLESTADHMVHSIKDILPVVLKNQNHDGSSSNTSQQTL